MDGTLAIPQRRLEMLERASAALAEAREIDDFKKVRDTAEAVRHYIRQQRLGLDAQQDAAEIKVRAERRIGELLASGTQRKGKPKMLQNETFSKLPDGISRIQSHRYQRVATLDAKEFESHLVECRKSGHEITTAGVVRLVKSIKKTATASGDGFDILGAVENLDAIVSSGSKFGCIYVDPPWRYGNQGTRASTDNHYPTLTVDDIAALPVGELAAEKSHLWLWTTNGFLFECPKLFAAWGFEFKSSYVWVKTQIGIGNYLRNAHEFLLLAVRGGLVGKAKDVKSWGEFDRGKHSSKPESIRTSVIEKVSEGPFLELFAREQVPGWTVWGNQVASNLFGKEAG